MPAWLQAVWIALAACGGSATPTEQGAPPPTSAPPTPAPPAVTARTEVVLPSPTATAVDWPALPRPAAALETCPTPDVPFGQSCPRARLDCMIGDAKRVHCQCAGSEWRCLSGPPACFERVRAGAACDSAAAACELGNGLVFRTCACRDDRRWSCTGYGL